MKLIKATLNDIKSLQEICIEAYSKSFKDHWIKNGFDLYIDNQFNETKLTEDITNPNTDYYFISFESNNVGFLKIKYSINNTLNNDSELVKIYILPECKGKGIGKLALNQIINKLCSIGKKTLILDVIDTNTNSIFFYEKMGFKKTGVTTLEEPFFRDELRGMFIMKLELS